MDKVAGDPRCHPSLGFSSLVFQGVRAEVKLNESRQFLGSSKATRSTYCSQSGWDTGLRRSLVLVSSTANVASDSSYEASPMGRPKGTTEPTAEAPTQDKPTLHGRQEIGLSESKDALCSFHHCFKGPDPLALPVTPECLILAIPRFNISPKQCCTQHTALAHKKNQGQAEICLSGSLPSLPPHLHSDI